MPHWWKYDSFAGYYFPLLSSPYTYMREGLKMKAPPCHYAPSEAGISYTDISTPAGGIVPMAF